MTSLEDVDYTNNYRALSYVVIDLCVIKFHILDVVPIIGERARPYQRGTNSRLAIYIYIRTCT